MAQTLVCATMITFARTALLLCIFATSLRGVTLSPGDVVVAASANGAVTQQVLTYSTTGTLLGTLQSLGGAPITQLSSDASGSVYAGLASPLVIERFSPTGTMTQFPGNADGGIVNRATGDVYGFHFSNAIPAGAFALYTPAGVLSKTISTTANGANIDLHSDQCTMYLAGSAGRLTQVDVCQGGAQTLLSIPSFAAFPASVVSDVRILPDRTLLIAADQNVVLPPGAIPTITQIKADGSLVRTHAYASTRIALNVDAASVWTIQGTKLVLYDLATDAQLQSIDTQLHIDAIAVVGEPRAALLAANVPVNSKGPVFALIAVLATIALARIR